MANRQSVALPGAIHDLAIKAGRSNRQARQSQRDFLTRGNESVHRHYRAGRARDIDRHVQRKTFDNHDTALYAVKK